jgi:alanine racemase
VGVVPQGYSDGYDRGLSNSGEMLVQGKRCRVLGRVAMNMLTIDLSNAPEAKAGDEVVLLGAQGDEKMTADALAEACGTISYEIIARLNPLLPRLLTD